MAATDAPPVHRSVEVQAPVDEVWELLVDDEERAAWFGGPTTIDPVPGGAGAFTDPDGTRRDAVVHDVDPGRRLTWTWWPSDDEDGTASRVDVELHPTPGGTRVSVTEAPLTSSPRACSTATPGRRVPLLALETTCLVRAFATAVA